MALHLYKFLIRADEWRKAPDDPDHEWSACVADVIAESEAGALRNLQRYAAENGKDARWLKAARVIEIPLIDGAVGAWAQL